MHAVGLNAFNEAVKNKSRKFPGREDARNRQGLLFPDCTPSFFLEPGQTIFTIGSCFARNVEQILLREGFHLPTAHFTAPEEEAPGQPNRILNQYNPGTMAQCLRARETEDFGGMYEVGPDSFVDCLLATGSRPVTQARAVERRKQINALYKEELSKSDFVFITVGLIECWYDEQSKLFLNEAPPKKLMQVQPGKFSFVRLNVQQCEEMLREMLTIMTNNGKKGIVTVSPVPLQVTFAGGDAITRNTYSKSVLRAACETVISEFPGVDYFPSYEIAISAGLTAFGQDNVHIRPIVVNHIIDYMTSLYLRK
jgi:GSCFA family